ncbi:MAG: response regulator [Desulfobacter sp.]|nr:response regulator [Desulfobacter sp.]WDP84165.1 MAG: response regulator [Desulfobacter sp.]
MKSRPGKGTVFKAYFPVIKTAAEPEEKTRAEPIVGGTEHVLLVDDEIIVADATRGRLNALGYRVTIETDSVQALERFRQGPGDYDLVITDMTMPGMSGEKMAREIMGICPKIPVILSTGFNPKICEQKALEKGFAAFLTKPVALRDMAMALRRALDGLDKKDLP